LQQVIILKIYGFPLLAAVTMSRATLIYYIAASLGQVYKGRLKETGELVAVKVQRPFVLETVTIDLFIIRNLGLVLRRFPQVNLLIYTQGVAGGVALLILTYFFITKYCQVSIDVVGLVDEWAARFFEELDYVNEGENGTYFAEMMEKDLPQVIVLTSIYIYCLVGSSETLWFIV
jgi:aarF domain-containing kinase